MSTELIVFLFTAVVAVIAAAGMLLSRNAVYAALFLIMNLAAIAILYLLLQAPFIAMVQVTVYAGAIMVLFLFVIMLLGAERLGSSSTLAWQRPLAIGLGVLLILMAGYVFFFRSGILPQLVEADAGFGSPGVIGDVLFTQYVLPLEVTGVLLLVAMIGAIVLTKRT